MTIYYNPFYSASPYRSTSHSIELGNMYCGDIQLLQRLLFYANVPFMPASNEVRFSYYHTNMLRNIKSDSPFYNSFKTDSAGMSRTILAWRDALVEVGWDMQAYNGNSIKLSLIRDMEPTDMPRGEVDYWYILQRLAEKQSVSLRNIDIVVTCGKDILKPHIAYIISKLQDAGVKVEYRPIEVPYATGNLGKIQEAVISNSIEKIALDINDNTFCYTQFTTEDDVMRYIATEPIDREAVYYCSKPKLFDNTLKLLGKPTIGSSLNAGLTQVIQLFTLGNGLFEYPLNINRIIEWLNLPISPIDKGLRSALSNALISSGGIYNKDWNTAKEKYLDSTKDTKERNKISKQYDEFLPLPKSAEFDIECIKTFNNNLRKWATKRLAMKDFPYSESVRNQISAVQSYTTSIINMLDNAPADFKFLDLQLWCKSMVQPSVYDQYTTELGSHPTISAIGDIHDVAEKIIWFPAEDEGVASYPFDMLNDAEINEAKQGDAKIYDRNQHSLINQSAILRMLLCTKRLTIIEAEKNGMGKINRHPLVLQLNERIKGGLELITQRPTFNVEYYNMDKQVRNQRDVPTMLHLDADIRLKERYEREIETEKQAESYSSLSQLINHPFTYVCEKCAKLKDHSLPSAQDINKTLGNVAHLMIEKTFGGKSIDEATKYYKTNYDTIFEEAVNEAGLLLRMPEYGIDLLNLRNKMKYALRELANTIVKNGLKVEACEYEFKQTQWPGAGKDVTLGARADMLLSDQSGGKVIFDFKYSNSKSRGTEIEENRALQLELYRFMTKREFGITTPVRVAYIHLPDVTIYTADSFPDIEAIEFNKKRIDADVMTEAANSYKFRWEQLKDCKIERQEGKIAGSGEYGAQQTALGLFPLNVYKNIYSEDKFNTDYKKLK